MIHPLTARTVSMQVQMGCLLTPKGTGCSGQELGFFSSCVFILLSHQMYFVRNTISYNKKPSDISVRKGVFVLHSSSLISI